MIRVTEILHQYIWFLNLLSWWTSNRLAVLIILGIIGIVLWGLKKKHISFPLQRFIRTTWWVFTMLAIILQITYVAHSLVIRHIKKEGALKLKKKADEIKSNVKQFTKEEPLA